LSLRRRRFQNASSAFKVKRVTVVFAFG